MCRNAYCLRILQDYEELWYEDFSESYGILILLVSGVYIPGQAVLSCWTGCLASAFRHWLGSPLESHSIMDEEFLVGDGSAGSGFS